MSIACLCHTASSTLHGEPREVLEMKPDTQTTVTADALRVIVSVHI